MKSKNQRGMLPVSLCAASAFIVASTVLAAPPGSGQGSEWPTAGADRQNTRFQQSEHALSPANVVSLVLKWSVTTGGDVSATPSVDDRAVYFPDRAGFLYAVDRLTGQVKWTASIAAASGVPGDHARATPAVTRDKVIVGTQGPFGGGGKVLAFDKFAGTLLWSTTADTHVAASITQSATVFDGRVYVGVASQEEQFALLPGYTSLSFRGSMLALDEATGQIIWKTYMAPVGYTGNAVWGSSPAVDSRRGQVYIATGNNYSVPEAALACVKAAGNDPNAMRACLAADDFFDSVLALDMKTGAIRWATNTLGFDAWTYDCIPFLGSGSNCPDPAGSNFDFAQAPALFKAKGSDGKQIELLGAGQKSGRYWALKPDTGAVVWVTQAGPGGTTGGLQWGSAVDGTRIYTANANSNGVPWTLPNGATTVKGIWSGIDASTGQILWQTADPAGKASGPVTTANGVVFGCSLDAAGHMYALNAATGAVLWSFASGGSCISGAAISDGMLYWGSGYGTLGTPNNKLFAFGLPN